MLRVVAFALLLAPGATAEVLSHETPGNLEVLHELDCLALDELKNEYSPADLVGGMVQCYRSGQDDRAVDLYIVSQLRAAFDTRRVLDKSAHGAGVVLLMNAAEAEGPEFEKRISAAFEKVGGTGTERHKKTCAQMEAYGAPTHSPNYMVQHGMRAFSNAPEEALAEDFDPDLVWAELLRDYMKCAG